MNRRGWPLSMLDFAMSEARDSNPKPGSTVRATGHSAYRYAYADAIRLEQYRKWLASKVRAR